MGQASSCQKRRLNKFLGQHQPCLKGTALLYACCMALPNLQCNCRVPEGNEYLGVGVFAWDLEPTANIDISLSLQGEFISESNNPAGLDDFLEAREGVMPGDYTVTVTVSATARAAQQQRPSTGTTGCRRQIMLCNSSNANLSAAVCMDLCLPAWRLNVAVQCALPSSSMAADANSSSALYHCEGIAALRHSNPL